MNTKISNLLRFAIVGALSGTFLLNCGSAQPDQEPTEPLEGPGELYMSSLERELSPQIDAEDLAQFSADNREFAFALFDHLRESSPGENLFFSPYSISTALAMTYAGATDQTYEQMGALLRFRLEEEQLHRSFNWLDLELKKRSEVELGPDEDGDAPILRVVNQTFGQQGYDFHEDFLDTLALNYGAGLRGMDFANDPEGSREEINQWVEDQTEERIKDLLPAGSILPSTVMVLANAIYFLAGWAYPFERSFTTEGTFHGLNGASITTDLMSREGEGYQFYLGANTQAIAMPYVGKELALIALQPEDGADFETWEAGLTQEHFDEVVANLRGGSGKVTFPSFTFEGDYDLMEHFEEMGWTDFGSLRRMLPQLQGGLEITGIFHKGFIALDEEGTEAAAATAVVVGESSAISQEFDLRFDRPFVYAIYDVPSDTILFLGRVLDPSAE